MPALSTPPPLTGSAGGPGIQGPPGVNSYSFTTADVTGYDGRSNLTLSLQDVSWVPATGPVFVAGVGSFQVQSIDTANKTFTLLPLKTDIGTPPYNIPTGTQVSSSGFPGLNGATGNTGPQGPVGVQGPSGPQGLQGPAGQVGATGATGPQGNPGVQGATGSTGATGATGPIGPQGPIGVKGDQGPVGIQGIQGPQGPQGQQGVTGPAGPQGIQGPPGPAVTAQGLWNPSTVYAQGDLVTYNNLIYIGLRASQNAQPDTHSQDWAVYSSVGIQGPQGPPGATGAAGAQGPQGVPGPQGPVGADGATGATGAAGPVGPKGDTGPQGAQGQVGATGPVGPTGPQGVPGAGAVWRGNWTAAANYSANDAVSYNGSSYVALASNTNQPPATNPTLWELIAQKGDVGATGPQGPIGNTGPQGPQGVAGPTGPQGATGPTGPPGPTAVSGDAGNTAMLGSDSRIYVPTLALATTTKIGALNKLTGNTTDVLDGTNNFQPLANAVQPTIWSVRLRAYNALGNSNFEVDQRNIHSSVANLGSGTTYFCDRWQWSRVGSHQITGVSGASSSSLVLPGTSYRVSADYLAATLTTAQATLAAGDLGYILQYCEGSAIRELFNDVTSISLLVQSSVAPLNISVVIRDNGSTRSIVHLFTIPTANTWTLLKWENIPTFISGGAWSLSPGVLGATLGICLGAGTTFTAGSADTWLTGNFLAAPGTTNWFGQAVNSVFYIGYIQWEPGPLASTLIDKPFSQNYDESLRYFCKSYNYGVKAGAASQPAYEAWPVVAATTSMWGVTKFPKPMAKTPTFVPYCNDGTPNGVTLIPGGSNWGISSSSVSERGVGLMNTGTAFSAGSTGGYFHYAADSGW